MLAVRNLRPDYGRCRPPGIHCTLRGNHLYSTPEVTEEHEIGKQLKHHSACEAQGTEKVKLFVLYVCFILFGSGWGHFQTTVFFSTFPPNISFAVIVTPTHLHINSENKAM